MGSRTELQTFLELTLGSEYVYFQPPESTQMKYPCIVYSLNGIRTKFANDRPYVFDKSYQLTVIDKNPDSLIPGKLLALQKCKFDRQYVTDNLYHNVFTLYF